MAKAIPSSAEISHELLISLFTATLGVILGIIINECWQRRKTGGQQVKGHGSYPVDCS
jgi:hypothetical protein